MTSHRHNAPAGQGARTPAEHQNPTSQRSIVERKDALRDSISAICAMRDSGSVCVHHPSGARCCAVVPSGQYTLESAALQSAAVRETLAAAQK